MSDLLGRPPDGSAILVPVLSERHEGRFGGFVRADRCDVRGVLQQGLVPVPELVAWVERFPDREEAIDVAR